MKTNYELLNLDLYPSCVAYIYIYHTLFIHFLTQENNLDLFKDAAKKKGILDNINKRKTTLHTFNGALVRSPITVKLAVKAEPSNHVVTFHIMDCPTPHNVILSWNWLHKMKVVQSSYHQLLHYSTPGGVKEFKED